MTSIELGPKTKIVKAFILIVVRADMYNSIVFSEGVV
jgi:hypothetical protein